MLYTLKRHPVPIEATLRDCLVLTYALPRETLEPLLPPGLALDCFDAHANIRNCREDATESRPSLASSREVFGFLAVAVVQADYLRPAFLPPAYGRSFVLAGYRIFTKFRTPQGRTLRGLFILRSDANDRRMVTFGNLLTHYHYHVCDASIARSGTHLEVNVTTPDGFGDLCVRANPRTEGFLPVHSPFKTAREARRFAGPLPYTFDYEPQTHSIVVIKGVRPTWNPTLVAAGVSRCAFLEREPFRDARPTLASAFYVHDIPYRWERGRRFSLKEVSS